MTNPKVRLRGRLSVFLFFTANDHLQVLHAYIQTQSQCALEAPLSLADSFLPSEFLTQVVYKKM